MVFDSTELHSVELHSTDKNEELIKKHNDVFNGITDKIKEINSNECDYEKIIWKLNLIQMMTYH